jgi:hypothetical protein
MVRTIAFVSCSFIAATAFAQDPPKDEKAFYAYMEGGFKQEYEGMVAAVKQSGRSFSKAELDKLDEALDAL